MQSLVEFDELILYWVTMPADIELKILCIVQQKNE